MQWSPIISFFIPMEPTNIVDIGKKSSQSDAGLENQLAAAAGRIPINYSFWRAFRTADEENGCYDVPTWLTVMCEVNTD